MSNEPTQPVQELTAEEIRQAWITLEKVTSGVETYAAGGTLDFDLFGELREWQKLLGQMAPALLGAAERERELRSRLNKRLAKHAEDSGAFLALGSVWTSGDARKQENPNEWVGYGHRSDSWIEHDPELAAYLREHTQENVG